MRLIAAWVALVVGPLAWAAPVNVLLITADDLNCDTVGAFATDEAVRRLGVTPNIDKLASQGLRLARAHVTVAVCQPSRECLMTGRYPHRNGATGFYPVRPEVPTLIEVLKANGYVTGILGKVAHLAPKAKFAWDFQKDAPDLGQGRNPAAYGAAVKAFLEQAKKEGQPFFLMANAHDPHRPWHGSVQEQGRRPRAAARAGRAGANAGANDAAGAGDAAPPTAAKYPAPSRVYKPEEVPVPAFLADLPDVRAEVAQYLSSARRCDDTVGQVLGALAESGLEGTTLVMFLSDNGISMPFAKSNCYLHSTHTPWVVRWPGKTRPGTVDDRHFVSGIDFMPTVLEASAVKAPEGMDGRSFLPLLEAGTQAGRERVVTCYNDTSAGKGYPMRCLQTGRFGYIYNAWADGKTAYRSEAMSGLTFAAMQKAGAKDPAIAVRVEVLVHRSREELYDLESDPNCLKNLAGDAGQAETMRTLRGQMLEWMKQTGDPLATGYARE